MLQVAQSFSKEWCEKRAWAGERQITGVLFSVFLFYLSPYYTIWEPGTGYTEFGGGGEVFGQGIFLTSQQLEKLIWLNVFLLWRISLR